MPSTKSKLSRTALRIRLRTLEWLRGLFERKEARALRAAAARGRANPPHDTYQTVPMTDADRYRDWMKARGSFDDA